MNPSTSLGTRSNMGMAKPSPLVRQAAHIWRLLVIRGVYRRSVPSGCAQVKYRCRCRVKYREMVILGILAFRGASQEGLLAHLKRAIAHGATKRELLEAMESAAVPGGGPTFATGARALMQLDAEGAFKNG